MAISRWLSHRKKKSTFRTLTSSGHCQILHSNFKLDKILDLKFAMLLGFKCQTTFLRFIFQSGKDSGFKCEIGRFRFGLTGPYRIYWISFRYKVNGSTALLCSLCFLFTLSYPISFAYTVLQFVRVQVKRWGRKSVWSRKSLPEHQAYTCHFTIPVFPSGS